jgi:hypothetical protein
VAVGVGDSAAIGSVGHGKGIYSFPRDTDIRDAHPGVKIAASPRKR